MTSLPIDMIMHLAILHGFRFPCRRNALKVSFVCVSAFDLNYYLVAACYHHFDIEAEVGKCCKVDPRQQLTMSIPMQLRLIWKAKKMLW